MAEIRSQTADTAAMAAIHKSLAELNTRTLTVEEMVRSQSLVNERTAASLERIFGVLEKLQEDRTTERRAEKQPMQSPLSGDSPPILPTPATPQHQQLVLNTSIRPSTTTAPLLKYFGNSGNEVPTEDVISSKVSSNTSKVNVENVSAAADTSVGKVFPLQSMVTVNPYEHCSYLFDIKVAVVDWNGETSSEWKFGVVKNVLKSRLPPVCENDSANVLCLFVTKMAFVGNWCYIQPLVIAAKPPAKPPDVSLNMLGQTNQMLSKFSKISCDMFKSMVRWKKDDASIKCLIFVGWFISIYITELSRPQMASTKCAKSDVSALLDVVALAGNIVENGTHINVGLKDDKDEMSYHVRYGGNNQWLPGVVMRSESKLLCFVRLERATSNTHGFSRLQTNVVFNELCKMIGSGKPSNTHGSLVVGDAWLQKLNYKSNHIFDYYRIGNMHTDFLQWCY